MKHRGLLPLFNPFSQKTVYPSHSSVASAKTKCQPTSMRDLLKLTAQIAVPCMIGVFTIVIALQQHNSDKENRRKDLEIAQQLRQQQFELDEQRRAQELALDEARRAQDLAIADDKQRDAVFSVYIRDLTNLLLLNNYLLDRPTLTSIVRPMTLTVLRQLDPSRKVLLLKFLYESKMLQSNFEETRVDLSDGDLNGVQLRHIRMSNLSLPGALLANASFVSSTLILADFHGADLTDASFAEADLTDADFYRARLVRAQFTDAHLTLADFAMADLTQSTLTKRQLDESSSYNMAILPDGSEGENVSLIYADDQCLSYKWNFHPKHSVNLTDQCHLVALQSNVTMVHRVPLFLHWRLIAKQAALLQFRFQAKIHVRDSFRVMFVYFDEEQDEEIHRELGMIISSSPATVDGFVQYEMSAGYPSNGFYLNLQIMVSRGDVVFDLEFYIQHFDYSQYRQA